MSEGRFAILERFSDRLRLGPYHPSPSVAPRLRRVVPVARARPLPGSHWRVPLREQELPRSSNPFNTQQQFQYGAGKSGQYHSLPAL